MIKISAGKTKIRALKQQGKEERDSQIFWIETNLRTIVKKSVLAWFTGEETKLHE